MLVGCQKDTISNNQSDQTINTATQPASNPSTNPTAASKPYESLEELVKLIRSLKPWKTMGDMSEQDLDKYIEVAKIAQQTDSDLIMRAIWKYMQENDVANGREDDLGSRVFLLSRIVFELPENAPLDSLVTSGRWIPQPQPNPDGTVNVSWPIEWRNGRPRLICDLKGYMGNPYNAGGEYDRLKRNYPFRKLP